MEKNYSYIDLSLAYFQKKAKIYKDGGYKKAVSLKRNIDDYENHLFTFLIDINFCLLPVYLWVIEFLLILTGLIPPRMFDILFYIMFVLLFITSVILLPVMTSRTHGVTFGGEIMGIRIVNRQNRIVNGFQLILRQAIGMGIPLMLFGYLFKTWGILGWWLINGIASLISPNQQTIMDIVLGLHLVYESETHIRFEPESQEKNEEEICPVDLHIRSNYSDDGYYDVEEIFKQAKELGLDTISITDHNCARQNAAAFRFADLYKIQYIPGVELDAQYGDIRVRVLGYYIDWEHEIFDVLERASLKREK